MIKQDIQSLLEQGPCKVCFEKADGSIREMLCTTNKEFIDYETAGESKQNPNVVIAWDLEKLAWRSFRIDRIVSFPERVKL